MSNHTPTPEQEKIFAAVEAGHDVVVAAGAGAGKTSTVVGIAQRTKSAGMLITFNKSIAKDAEPKLKGTGWTAKTAHALAYAWMCKPQQRGIKARFSAKSPVSFREVRTFVGARDFKLNGEHTLEAFQIVRIVKDAHAKFCSSADEQLNERHVRRSLPPLPEGVSPDKLVAYVLPMAKRYSADAMSTTGQMHLGFNEMLKLYQLSNPQLPVSAIGYDEAQDANPVILDIVSRQRCQKIIVGDSNQQIYEWRGAVDAMERFAEQPGTVVLGLTKSFRFGQTIADTANLFLAALDSRINGDPFRIVGNEKVDSKIGLTADPNAILCRSNAGTLNEALFLLEEGKKVAIVGGGDDIKRFAFGARELQLDPKSNGGKGTTYPELAAFDNWEEVLEYADKGEADQDFKRLVKIISDWGVGQVLRILSNLVSETEADIVISTAHKAKGREWDRVQIGADFKPSEKKDETEDTDPSKSELRLGYVAVTRAKLELDLGGLTWIRSFAPATEESEAVA